MHFKRSRNRLSNHEIMQKLLRNNTEKKIPLNKMGSTIDILRTTLDGTSTAYSSAHKSIGKRASSDSILSFDMVKEEIFEKKSSLEEALIHQTESGYLDKKDGNQESLVSGGSFSFMKFHKMTIYERA